MRFYSHFYFVLALCLLSGRLLAHVGDRPSVHDTVAAIAQRMQQHFTEDQLNALTPHLIEQFLTDEEKSVLAQEHIRFKVNVPVKIGILRDRALKSEPFWIREDGWQLSGLVITVQDEELDLWEKEFPEGDIGLGVHSLGTSGVHYIPLIQPLNASDSLIISDTYPGTLQTAILAPGVQIYADREETLEAVPQGLEGTLILQTIYDSRFDASLVNFFKWTAYPSQPKPDQVVLTWSEDPQTTQTIQWRTDATIRSGQVLFQKKRLFRQFSPKPLDRVKANMEVLETPNIINDPLCHRFTVTLRDLEPDTTYFYSVGDGAEDHWTELAEFTTAPASTKPFSFIYMGDAQNGLDRWGSLVHTAFRERPDAAFYIMAGDLVNRGGDRDDWDSLFENAKDIYDRRPLVPAIGNHEDQDPTLYLREFDLPKNGPEKVEKERAYWFEYSNALFVILDTNISAESQASWLKDVLNQSSATWKFVVYHHPAYSSAPSRDNPSIREHWLPLFDEHHVDMALQGHDHAYLRTYPMKDGKRVDTTNEGTVYIVSVSGVKMYDQDPRDYTEFGMTNTATYQVLDIQISGDRLVYRAYDTDGNLKDELVIEK